DKEPGFVCVVDPDGREWSRGEFVAQVNRLSHAFHNAQWNEGDSVAIVSPNCAEFLITYFAATQAALSVVPINWHLSEQEVAFILGDSGAKAIVVHRLLGSKLRETIRRVAGNQALLLSIGSSPGYRDIGEFLESEPDRALGLSTVGRVMAYTSATTG